MTPEFKAGLQAWLPDPLTQRVAKCFQSCETVEEIRIQYDATHDVWMVSFIMVDFVMPVDNLERGVGLQFSGCEVKNGQIRGGGALAMTVTYKEPKR